MIAVLLVLLLGATPLRAPPQPRPTDTSMLFDSILRSYPGPQSRCIEARRNDIVQRATVGQDLYKVPVSILMAVGFLETHLGCDRGEGGGWGAPISRTRRHEAGTSNNTASALRWGMEVCGNWIGAVSHFRCGLCHCRRYTGYSASDALHFSEVIHRRADVPLPNHFR